MRSTTSTTLTYAIPCGLDHQVPQTSLAWRHRQTTAQADPAARQAALGVEIIKGSVSKDHVHLLVSVPPHGSVSKLMQQLKGKSSSKLVHDYRRLERQFWGRHLWARGYFCASRGNVTDEAMAA